ncbi:hypothetical protein MKZ38_005627 [Zalerion maritima]|uniref:Uncharacterized protein n=1 Tax=Zalerion maritima TaxID=339359 RepID=A0AAD5WQ83_9PEZI|nr:hypothetical protein MKZ38_005627 [Zalerion maritima]
MPMSTLSSSPPPQPQLQPPTIPPEPTVGNNPTSQTVPRNRGQLETKKASPLGENGQRNATAVARRTNPDIPVNYSQQTREIVARSTSATESQEIPSVVSTGTQTLELLSEATSATFQGKLPGNLTLIEMCVILPVLSNEMLC